MDFSTLQVTEQVILEKAQKAELFTAYDVTREVRRRVGRGTNVPHNDVKQEVHNFFANGQMGTDYTRTLANLNLPSGTDQPWIYHPNTADPTNYSNVTVVQTHNGVNAVTAVVKNDGGDDGVNLTSDGTYKVDARDTLCLPKALLQDAGLIPGDTANVAADALQGVVAVMKAVPDPSVYTALSTYTVDKYGNVRVTQHTLQRAGCGGKEYEIDGDANKVVVKVRN